MAMHVVFVITRGDALGGATVHVRDMAMYLLDRGFQATVLVGEGRETPAEFARCGIPYRCVPGLRQRPDPLRDLAALRRLVAELRELKPDLVSVHTAKAGLLGRVAARIAGVPVTLFTPHGWAIADRISPASGRVIRIAERAAAPLATAIVNVCESEKLLAEKHRVGLNRLAVIHNGVLEVSSDLRADPGLQPPRIAMVARFEPPKDHPLLLRALASLGDRAWQAEFVGAGPGLPEARSLAAALGIADRVQFTGSSGNVAEQLSRAQIFVLTSNSEGFPRSILEAMRAGLPVVASDVGGVAEAVAHGESGFVVRRGDEAALRTTLAVLIDNPALRRRLGRSGRRRYELSFTFDNAAARTFALYRKVLGESTRLARSVGAS